jgi:hypothetical protein
LLRVWRSQFTSGRQPGALPTIVIWKLPDGR